jgi:hypothetical protein
VTRPSAAAAEKACLSLAPVAEMGLADCRCDQWGRFLPEHTTAVSLLDRLLHHAIVAVTEGESFRMRQARNKSGGRLTKN